MRMNFHIELKILPLLLLPWLLLTACQSDYTEEALQKAREFTLDQTRMLPEVSRNYIRYATPALQTRIIFRHRPMRLTEYEHLDRNVDFNPAYDPKLDTIVSQFVWNPPEAGYSVIAIGRSRRNLSYWEPLKVILKNTASYRTDYENARAAAIRYVTNYMLYLSPLERVRVRTSETEVRETNFDLEYMFEEQLESSADEWKNFLQSLKEQRDRRQFSLIWKADDPKKRIVITGFGSVGGLDNWAPACGMVIPAAQLNEYTQSTYLKGPDEPVSPENTAP